FDIRLRGQGMTHIKRYAASKTDTCYMRSDAFRLSRIVLASPTYDSKVYPPVRNFILDMEAINLHNRTTGVIYYRISMPQAEDVMPEISGKMRNTNVLEEDVLITSSMKEEDVDKMETLANSIIESME